MRIFLAGATGAVGKRLVPLLLENGHEVTGLTRSPAKAGGLRDAGAEPVVGDVLDADATEAAVVAARPDVVIHEATDLSSLGFPRNVDRAFAGTNALRTRGTDNLIAAARAAGAKRILVQSFAGWPYAREGGPVKTEDDPLDPEPPKTMRQTLDAMRHLESAVTGADDLEGMVLRYGGFYGPGTSIARGAAHYDLIQKRRFPIVGDGGGVWSLVHIDDVAGATLAAVDRGSPGIYNVVDDEPAPVSVWLPILAEALGAKPPHRIPTWLGRLAAGDAAVSMMTSIRGASNAKAKRELGWEPTWPTWREGFRRGLGEESGALGAARGNSEGLAANQALEPSHDSP
jgi:nucleoside-diphosphate-sugar epimerase